MEEGRGWRWLSCPDTFVMGGWWVRVGDNSQSPRALVLYEYKCQEMFWCKTRAVDQRNTGVIPVLHENISLDIG